ncbi:MAG: hypothetical protein EA424_16540 [Planctomycetaceae bacterium]|nr:MAG: hypothetical protein EA424_16540 [Planctomycetaceae bacterium]
MGRFWIFFWGMVVGAILLYGAMTYHVVNTHDGLQVVPKTTSGLAGTYVDIRGFGIDDWAEHRDLAMALIQAGKGELLGDAAISPVRETLEAWLKGRPNESP